jgi:hypothetical protein
MKRSTIIRIEGGIFSPDLLESLAHGDLQGQKPSDFGYKHETEMLNHLAALYSEARALYQQFRHAHEQLPDDQSDTTLTRQRWVIPLLKLLEYQPTYIAEAHIVDQSRYRISHCADESPESPPIHIVGRRQSLDRVDPTAQPRRAPHTLMQEFLNRTEHLWGIVTNGGTLRLLRDSTYLRKLAYLEFDLDALFGEPQFEQFLLFYRLLHRSRLPRRFDDASRCLLEAYYRHSEQQSGRVRERLREGVERALEHLANAFLQHPDNPPLRTGELPDPHELHQQLLRLVYRILFLLVGEERGLISDSRLYQQHYSVSRLRPLTQRYAPHDTHEDLWYSLCALWECLRKPELARCLQLDPLNGQLFEPIALEQWRLTNRDLLKALRQLFYYYDPDTRAEREVNYGALDVEELGSVYESLLDLAPEIDDSTPPCFEFAQGSERRTTGSFYTPPDLVAQLVQHALQPVIDERLATARTPDERERAILSIRVLDPACGSGHFLLAAARQLARELARVHTDNPSPEDLRRALREVITHCIYGVDRNPLAVELCKLALWMEGHNRGKPLTFLDHRIRCGDSLVGVADLAALRAGIPDAAYDRLKGTRALKQRNRAERDGQLILDNPTDDDLLECALQLEQLSRDPDDTPEQIHQKQQRYTQLRQHAERLRIACDLWTAAFFWDNPTLPMPTTGSVALCLSNPDALHPQMRAYAESLAHKGRYFHWCLEFADVMLGGGFDVILGNPPFLGGLKISGALGDSYRRWLEVAYPPFGNRADLCAVFFRRAFELLKPNGRMGLVATNTIGQGDTRESGLAVILRNGGAITFAQRFVKWQGAASVEVNLVAIGKGLAHPLKPILDGAPVPYISSRIDPDPEAEPKPLKQNEGKAFIGDLLRGLGFVLEPYEAESLIAKDPRNKECLFPYLNGEDLNSHPQQQPSRWVICFHDWTLEQARQYPDLLHIVEEKVKPEREQFRTRGNRRLWEKWWRFEHYGVGLRRAIAPLQRVLVRALTSEFHMMTFVPKNHIFSHALGVFAFDDDYHFALLQSSVHEAWVRRQASSLESRNRYTPTDCFDTFPFPPAEYAALAQGGWSLAAMPEPFHRAAQVGAQYHDHRAELMCARNIGLTKTYNLFHDPDCADADIRRLRELHEQMDRAVLACYGWSDLAPAHGFHKNERRQTRFTVSPDARREILHRLLALNQALSREGSGSPPCGVAKVSG